MQRRELIEKREDEWLAPWALRASRSRGRLEPEPRHAYRTEFQRDRDRVLHSRAFRRLQFKTQVLPFPFHSGDHVRNRLTHTLEVAQIARTVARALRANEDLVEAIVLAHDLGHPPFGHAGERILHELLAPHGGFEHNRQSLRIVDFLERRSSRYDGLNLTHETRAGLLKHGSDFPRYPHAVPLPELGRHASVEGQIANLADEIAYHSHDLDDGLRSDLLDWDGLCRLELWQRALESADVHGVDDPQLLRSRVIIRVIDLLCSDLIETTSRNLTEHGVCSPEDAQRAADAVVAFSGDVRAWTRDVARYLFEHFYQHPQVVGMVAKAGTILRELWSAYIAHPARLPPSARAEREGEGIERAIADYVAGMTDRFALEEHGDLSVPDARG